MARRVWLAGRDLVFRARLAALVAAAGAELASDEAACDVAVMAADAPDSGDRIRALVGKGIRVLAYGPHVRADLLRAARDAGAVAVPNSEVEKRLKEMLRAG